MLINLVIFIAVTSFGRTVGAIETWQDSWEHNDWEKDWPGGWGSSRPISLLWFADQIVRARPAVYTPPAPKYTWWHDPKPTKTKTAPPTTASPASSLTSTSYASVDNACNSVRKLQSSLIKTSPSATATIPAQLAYECSTRVPFNSSAAGEA